MYPLRFQPIFRRYLWGGHRLSTVLQKPIGSAPAAESWEIVDHQDDQSVVAWGPLAGRSLRQLVTEFGAKLIGEEAWQSISRPELPPHLKGRFPLLFKFLDANDPLSVQVHPDDAYGATLTPPDFGKTEAWYVMHADPGAKIYAGLKPGVTKSDFARAIDDGRTESTLHCFEPQRGDCVFIPAGTLHALGAGLVIAEIQQASNTTFRVFDWDRVDAQGNGRPLHIKQAIEVTDFSRGPVESLRGGEGQGRGGHSEGEGARTLVACDHFTLKKRTLMKPTKLVNNGSFRILAVTQGEITIDSDPSGTPLQIGQTVLLPASIDEVTLTPGDSPVELLEIQ